MLKTSVNKKLLVGVLTLLMALMGLSLVNPSKLQAESAAEDPADISELNYVAAKQDNLTYLARRNIQIISNYYKDGVEFTGLNTAQLVAAETCLVQKMGSFQLAIGQQVAIPTDATVECINFASDLTEEQEALWQVYVPAVRTDLGHIQPIEDAKVYDRTGEQAQTSDSTAETTGQTSESGESNQTGVGTTEGSGDQTTGSIFSNIVFWAFGILLIFLIWQLFITRGKVDLSQKSRDAMARVQEKTKDLKDKSKDSLKKRRNKPKKAKIRKSKKQ